MTSTSAILDNLEADVATLRAFLDGAPGATVNLPGGGTVYSLRTYTSGLDDGTPAYDDYADLPAATPEGALANVTDDPTPANNGVWRVQGATWVYLGASLVGALTAALAAVEATVDGLVTIETDGAEYVLRIGLADAWRVAADGRVSLVRSDEGSGFGDASLGETVVDAAGENIAYTDSDGRYDLRLKQFGAGFGPGAGGAALVDGHGRALISDGGVIHEAAPATSIYDLDAGAGVHRIWSAGADGVQTALTDGTSDDRVERVTSDGRVLFRSDRLGSVFRPFVMRSDGLDPLVRGDGQVDIILGYGQSLMSGVTSGPAVFTATPTHPGAAISFAGGARIIDGLNADNTTPYDIARLQQFTDLIGRSTGVSHGEDIGPTLVRTLHDRHVNGTRAILWINGGVGGQSWNYLQPGSVHWSSLCHAATRAARRIMALGLRPRIRAMVIVHGHSNGADGLDLYQGYLTAWRVALHDLCSRLGMPEDAIVAVTGCAGWTNVPSIASSEVPLAQIAFGLTDPYGLFCTSDYPIDEISPDGTHPTSQKGYPHLGELVAYPLGDVLYGSGHTPLHLASASLSGSTVTATFAGGSGAIAIDASYVTAAVDAGFKVESDAGPHTLSAITAASASTVTMTVSPAPTTNRRLRYAIDGTAGASAGRGSAGAANGQVRDSRAGVSIIAGAQLQQYAAAGRVTIT